MISGHSAPRYCPSCHAELYPVGRLRPTPTFGLRGKVLLTASFVVSSAIFVGVLLNRWLELDRWIHTPGTGVRHLTGFPGLVAMALALIPGIPLGLIAYRQPRFLKLSCSKCSWRERYRVGARGAMTSKHITPTRQYSPPGEPDYAQLINQMEAGPPAPGASTKDALAWAYAELARGRSPEEVTADLIDKGWTSDIAEHAAEIARRTTRHLRR